MIESIQFWNFRALQNTTLPLSPFTLIVGPNGSGKSTAMQAFAFVQKPNSFEFDKIVTANLRTAVQRNNVQYVGAKIDSVLEGGLRVAVRAGFKPHPDQLGYYAPEGPIYALAEGGELPPGMRYEVIQTLSRFRIFSFDAQSIAVPVHLNPKMELAPNGSNLAGVLDNLRDREPERFEALNDELGRWLPEFDRILFETPSGGVRAFVLRTRVGQHRIPASDLSHGTLFALTYLTLAYLPDLPSIVCFEEPERGIHPRLLRELRDGMYRLCYPQNYGEDRKPVQVIATTHSPYLLDLYKDTPEEIVIAQKEGQETTFERLSEKPNVEDFLQDAPLGEVWYSGILGGVPNRP